MARRYSYSGSRRVAAGGVLAAGSLALLWLACVAPSGRLGLAAVAGLFPVASVLTAGKAAGYLCWAASGILGLILMPDKGIALIYLVFFGLYPVVKGQIESLRRQALEWLLKLACFNGVLTLLLLAFRPLFLPALPQWLSEGFVPLYLVGNVVFVIYDIGLSRLIGLLYHRLGPGGRA